MGKIILGNCSEVMKDLEEESVDSIITDPPYGLSFMGKKWDYDVPSVEIWKECFRVLKPGGHLLSFGGTRTYHRLVVNIEDAGFEIRDMIQWIYGSGFPKGQNIGKAIDKKLGKEESERWQGWNTTLKPSNEPICLARKPLSEKTIVKNVLKHGTAALNIDACRVETDPDDAKPLDTSQGRWPANVIHDGSDEVISEFPQNKGAIASVSGKEPSNSILNVYGDYAYKRKPSQKRDDLGSASRFFYCAKTCKSDRGSGNNHPTVKPTDLMSYLIKLVTPSKGLVLDPFMGSGSTGKACILEGFDFIGIEKDEKYFEIAQQRIREALKEAKK